MNVVGKNLRLVVIRCPYDSLRLPGTQELFGRLMSMKLEGYRREYPYGILPVDTTDFLGDHHVVCHEESDGKLIPLMGMKSTFNDRCPKFRVDFPLMNYLRLNATPEFEVAAKEVFDRCQKSALRLSYESGLSISDEARSNVQLKRMTKELFTAIHVLYHSEISQTDEMLAMAATRFKVDRLFEFWGYERLASTKTREILPEISLPSHYGNFAVCMHLRNGFSAQALEAAEKFRSLWNERIVFSLETDGKNEYSLSTQAA